MTQTRQEIRRKTGLYQSSTASPFSSSLRHFFLWCQLLGVMCEKPVEAVFAPAQPAMKNMAIMLPHFGCLCRMAARFATKSGLTFSRRRTGWIPAELGLAWLGLAEVGLAE
ncbi:MAG: hypothetical protein SV422_07150 [Pseudomonadota bacterium]|nr:hypothetical protein [Pseudomonadota bacterium]